MLLLTSFISWWYGDGWRRQIQTFSKRIDGVMDFFSFSLLIKTLFSPFRQISAVTVDGGMDVKLRAMLDKLISRVVGAAFRLLIIVVGGFSLAVLVGYGVLFVALWAVVPALPLIGLALAVTGWTP